MFRRALLLACLAASPAGAHPHVFVDESVGFRMDGDALTGLRIVWLYDAFSTLVLYDQLWLDEDGDGQLNAEDLQKVAAGETEWAEDYEGDTYLFHGNAKVPLTRPENGTARMVGDRVEVTFDLPLADPLPMAGQEVVLKMYAPDYYYAYTAKAVLDTPEGCHTRIVPFTPDSVSLRLQAELAKLGTEEMPDDPNIGANFAEEARLACD
ncbi:DUF1007 family protein [Falsirhodobacter sp. 20TX0035]|uniref:DUF1007 family protein n=1 Tax=Falsirhodobacter sp. 20TX0035 TaxID=3022019 RepID=UPI00232F2787|nr:DUF1007 family protein [Falsirhodobacter sp. 20TX0035]MDB6454966.1 DUF1007 family protein [Falsirhodobacter sp. 20TX0035]